MKYCIVIPTYNNGGTLQEVIERALAVCPNVIVVNDGSTDSTSDILADIKGIEVVTYAQNRGKGYALCRGFERARQLGFTHVVTIDSDLQHFPEDIPLLVEEASRIHEKGRRGLLMVGARSLKADNMPRGNTFANRFSNFWFALQTLCRMPDTQSGFRLYSLDSLPPLSLISNRYEAELALLVMSAWRGVKLTSVPVRVDYPADRVSHFRPIADFLRISVLNTFLCLLALLYGYPSMLFYCLKRKLKS